LRLHAPGGRLEGMHSVSIKLAYRITIEFALREDVITPMNVGGHDTVY
jgi:hypothetical protein